MDLLFKRYASPYLLIDTLIETNSLSTYIVDMFSFINDELQEQTKWEFFLHKVFEESWQDFCDRINSEENAKEVDLGATLKKSHDIMNDFIPDEEGVWIT